MAEEFYAAAAGIYGGNWWCSPRNTMFPGVGVFSPCFLDVSNFHWPEDSVKPGRICDDDYGGSNDSGFSARGSNFLATNVENVLSTSALSDLNRTLFDDSEEVAEINSYVSILNELSGEDSSALIQNYLFGDSNLFNTGGISASTFSNHLPTSSEDHSSNLDRLSSPSFPKSMSNSKPSPVNKLRPSIKRSPAKSSATNAWDSTVVNSPTRQLRNRSDYPVHGTKSRSNLGDNKTSTRDVKSTIKRSTNMLESCGPKRPRIETPSPLPTFKVRKEKLGDRITALQQLVSPFGKTDTASVLHEAIEYIKFLHDQVHAFSTPYMKNGVNPVRPQKPELRTRGLCLVPISSAFPVAGETPVDFWTPNLGGTFR